MRVVFIPDILARPAGADVAAELGRLDGGVWATIEEDALLAALDAGVVFPLLYLTEEDYRAAVATLSGADLTEAVRRRIQQAERWPDMAIGVAYEGERRALQAVLAAPPSSTSAAEVRALVEDKLGTLADLLGFRHLAILPLHALSALVLERAWGLVAEIADAEREAEREGSLPAMAGSAARARVEAAARAEALTRLDGARRGVPGEPLPIHVPLRRGVHFPSAEPELIEALRRRFVPFVRVDGGCVAACTSLQLRDLRELEGGARVVLPSGAALTADVERLGRAELAQKLRALAADRRPSAVALLRHDAELAIMARAAELVLARTAAAEGAPSLAALSDLAAQTEPFLRIHAALGEALRGLGESAPDADLAAVERRSIADLALLERLTAARADLSETSALLGELHDRRRRSFTG